MTENEYILVTDWALLRHMGNMLREITPSDRIPEDELDMVTRAVAKWAKASADAVTREDAVDTSEAG